MSRFRHRCSSRYLRISPLHREFHAPLPPSSTAVSPAGSGLSPEISQVTCGTAYAPFTPNNSEQRSHPLYYRGCWHRVSRCFLSRYRLNSTLLLLSVSSLATVLYDPKTFITHAALLRQAFAHCARFPTAASDRKSTRLNSSHDELSRMPSSA